MKSNKFKLVRAILVAPLITLYLAGPFAHAQSAAAPQSNMPKDHMKDGMMHSDAMKKSMKMGMDSMQNMPMSGDTDKDFAMMMKMHHEQGVEMAQMELANGKSPAMKAIAKNIISAQKKEIAEFEKWLSKHK